MGREARQERGECQASSEERTAADSSAALPSLPFGTSRAGGMTRARAMAGGKTALHGLQRLNIAFDFRGDSILSGFQVEAGLEVHPNSRCVLEVPGEALGGVRGDGTTLVDDIGMRVTGTRRSRAILFMLRRSGFMNSSRRISPG